MDRRLCFDGHAVSDKTIPCRAADSDAHCAVGDGLFSWFFGHCPYSALPGGQRERVDYLEAVYRHLFECVGHSEEGRPVEAPELAHAADAITQGVRVGKCVDVRPGLDRFPPEPPLEGSDMGFGLCHASGHRHKRPRDRLGPNLLDPVYPSCCFIVTLVYLYGRGIFHDRCYCYYKELPCRYRRQLFKTLQF